MAVCLAKLEKRVMLSIARYKLNPHGETTYLQSIALDRFFGQRNAGGLVQSICKEIEDEKTRRNAGHLYNGLYPGCLQIYHMFL